ncbi:MAG TPA: glycosyltransferase [Microbacterium sp.]|nr:glycosyltransferase [Microbacterium sp.]
MTSETARQGAGREPGAGVLSRAVGFIYWHLVVGVLMCVAELPVVALLFFLGRAAANAPLVPLCLIPLAPVVSAGLFAMRARPGSDDLAPARFFLRGLRLGWADSLRVWTPPMIALAAVAGAIVALRPAGLPSGYAGVLVVIGVLVALWGVNCLTIATVFSFRWRDTARLAVFYLGRRWQVTLGTLALLIVAAGLVLVTSEAVLWLFQVVWISFLAVITRPLVAAVQERFTAE